MGDANNRPSPDASLPPVSGDVLYYKEQARLEKERADDLEQQMRTMQAEGEQHHSGRERARHERDQAMRERDQARRERDQAMRERDQAVHACSQAIRERDQALRYFNDMKARAEGVRPQDATIADPPGYHEEADYHPHTRAYPTSGPAAMLPGGWRIAGGSVRGRSHVHGKYRDDEFAIHPLGDQGALIAIADGVGAKELSRWGAYCAVQGAGTPTHDQPHVQRLLSLIQHSTAMDEVTEASIAFLLLVLRAASEHVLHYAAQHMDRLTADDLHSTFMTFLVVPRPDQRLFVASAQIGDGALILRRPAQSGTGFEWLFLQEPQFTGIDSKVVPFLRFDQDKWPGVCKTYSIDPGSVLLGMTDGTVDDMSTRMDEETGNFKDYEDFFAKMRTASLDAAQPGQGMVDFLGYKKRASGDDRTIVCVY